MVKEKKGNAVGGRGGPMTDGLKKNKKSGIWFGCPKCSYEPQIDESKSNENWSVFDIGKCPKCNTEMRLNFTDKRKP
jgi:ssDNA-binding Zn-finger/Zn-ribbon topoisomerase 1